MNMPAKPLTDILMVFLFLLLMAAPHTDSVVHEWLGIFLTIAFMMHTWLNRVWYRTLTKGRYNTIRVARLILNALLFLSLIGTMASAVPLSRTIFTFVGFKGELSFRTVHVFCAHWCFILAAVHLGLYSKRFCCSLERLFFRTRPHSYSNFVSSGLGIIFASYGIYAFLYRELIYPLTMQSSFMLWSENGLLFLLDYGAIFFLCVWVSNTLLSLVSKRESRVSIFTGVSKDDKKSFASSSCKIGSNV